MSAKLNLAFETLIGRAKFAKVDEDAIEAIGGTCPCCSAPGSLAVGLDESGEKLSLTCEFGLCLPSEILRASRMATHAGSFVKGTDAAAFARRLAQEGIAVIPVYPAAVCKAGGCHKALAANGCTQHGKHPPVRWKMYQENPPSLELVSSWIKRFVGFNWAMLTDGLAVLDCDSRDAYTYLEQAGATSGIGQYSSEQEGFRRRQFVYRLPAGVEQIRPGVGLVCADGVKRAIDVRGNASYVLIPGSVHKTGTTYEAFGDWTRAGFAAAPEFPAHLVPSTLEKSSTRDEPAEALDFDEDTLDAVQRHVRVRLARVKPTKKGQNRDGAAYRAACVACVDFGLSDDHALPLLAEWNQRNDPPLAIEVIREKMDHARKHAKNEVGSAFKSRGTPIGGSGEQNKAEQGIEQGADPAIEQGADVAGIIEQAKARIESLFEPATLAVLERWKLIEPGRFLAFKAALADAGIQAIREVERELKRRKAEQRKAEARELVGSKPEIKVSVGEVEPVIDQAQAAILGLGNEIYVRAGALCRLTRGAKAPAGINRPADAPTITLAPAAHVFELAARAARWYENREKDGEIIEVDVLPPKWAIEVLMARGSWEFPAIEGIIEAPTLRPNGSVLDRPGYDSETGLFLAPGSCSFAEVPSSPTLKHAQLALEENLEAFADFPFLEPCDRSAAVAFLLTLLARHAVDGCVPLFLVRASTAGTGKSLLADAVSVIATGRKAARFAQEDADDEARKRLLAVAIAGDPIVLIDNIDRPLGSAALDAAITARMIRDRILGRTETVSAPWHAVVAATGNNVQVKGDLARRVVPIDLDAGMERPEEREGFKHADLLSWCRMNRGRLVAAGLTILRGYIAAGKPRQDVKPYGSFEAWSDLIRSSLVWAGMPDPAAGRERVREHSDPTRDALREALQAWREVFGSRAVSVSEAIREIEIRRMDANRTRDSEEDAKLDRLREALGFFDIRFDGKRLNSRSIGNALAKHRDRLVDGLAFKNAGKAHGSGVAWRVEWEADRNPTFRAASPSGESGESGESVPNPSRGKRQFSECTVEGKKSQESTPGGKKENTVSSGRGLESDSPDSTDSPESPWWQAEQDASLFHDAGHEAEEGWQ